MNENESRPLERWSMGQIAWSGRTSEFVNAYTRFDEIDVLRAKAAAFDRVLARTDRDLHALCEVATICMNTRAIMPEFREISDYTEVVDVLGAFLERLGELPGLIEEYGLRCKSYGLALQSLGSDEQWGLRKMRDEILAKINAILGVAECSVGSSQSRTHGQSF